MGNEPSGVSPELTWTRRSTSPPEINAFLPARGSRPKEEDVETLKENGVPMMDHEPRVGLRGKKIAFTLPDALNGISIELSEP